MFWEHARIMFYQMMDHLDTISLGWYVGFAVVVIAMTALVDRRIKLVPNNHYRFGDKLE